LWRPQDSSSAGGRVATAERAKEVGTQIGQKGAEVAKEASEVAKDAFSDGSLTAKIKAKMALDDMVRARDISVSTTDGVVTVSGTVHSKAERERALQLAKETKGVRQVLDKTALEAGR
jgi:hyperosmotically inducible protein